MSQAFFLLYGGKGLTWRDLVGREMTPRERYWWLNRLALQRQKEADALKGG